MFLHQPEDGLAVPVIVMFNTHTIHVDMPSINELEHDYAVFDTIDDAIRAVVPEKRAIIQAARQFSRHYSEVFRDQISSGNLTIPALRELVHRHMPPAKLPERVQAARKEPALLVAT
jgi:hypothetical protein